MSPSPRLPQPYGPAHNGSIAYIEDGDIWTTDALGSDPRVLIAGPETDLRPVFSRDGTRIALLRQHSDSTAGLRVAMADGTDVRRVAVDDVTGFGWSPSGAQLAVAHWGPGAASLSNDTFAGC